MMVELLKWILRLLTIHNRIALGVDLMMSSLDCFYFDDDIACHKHKILILEDTVFNIFSVLY